MRTRPLQFSVKVGHPSSHPTPTYPLYASHVLLLLLLHASALRVPPRHLLEICLSLSSSLRPSGLASVITPPPSIDGSEVARLVKEYLTDFPYPLSSSARARGIGGISSTSHALHLICKLSHIGL